MVISSIQKELDLSMYYMRGVTELSQSSNFSSSEYIYVLFAPTVVAFQKRNSQSSNI